MVEGKSTTNGNGVAEEEPLVGAPVVPQDEKMAIGHAQPQMMAGGQQQQQYQGVQQPPNMMLVQQPSYQQPPPGYMMVQQPPPGHMMVQQPGMMAATTVDPNMQCYFEGCSMLGTSMCRWDNHCCRNPSAGGCRRRFCQNHRF